MFRLNKCIPAVSRRTADKLIQEGMVDINDSPAHLGDMISFGDILRVGGNVVDWQSLMRSKMSTEMESMNSFLYLKYWKPIGVTCTTSAQDPSNLIDRGGFRTFPQRLFPVGRLDKDSSGLLLLTSDTRLDRAFLQPEFRSEKVYNVELSGAITDHQITLLSDGIDIPVEVKRKNQIQHSMVFRTAPCEIRRLPAHPDTETIIQVTLTEGKNRQIRKMVKTVGLRVRALHRIGFCALTLASLRKPGDWRHLDERELKVVQNAIQTISPHRH